MLIQKDGLLYGTPYDWEEQRRKDLAAIGKYFTDWSAWEIVPKEASCTIDTPTVKFVAHLKAPQRDPVEAYDRSQVWKPGADNELFYGVEK
jgi:hypothetical protein